jgi:hypothetical protein
VLPAKNILNDNGDPTTPHFKAFGVKPKIGNYRVFGCPASSKRYNATSRCTQTQQATHGIFIGFPSNQAGWLFYTEQLIGTRFIHVSHDATFDENFDSALVFDLHPFQGSLAFRRTPAANQLLLQSFKEQQPEQQTGSVADFQLNTFTQAQSEEGNETSSTEPPALEYLDESEHEEDEDDSEFNTPDTLEQEKRYPNRKRRRNPKYFSELTNDEPEQTEAQAMFTKETITFNPLTERMDSSLDEYKTVIIPDFEQAYAPAIQENITEQIDLYLPEP